MAPAPRDPDRFREERRRILRRAAVFTYATFFAALVVAVIGAALVAWMLSFAGFPFRETWLVLIVVILGVPLLARLVAAVRGKGGEAPSGGGVPPGGEPPGGETPRTGEPPHGGEPPVSGRSTPEDRG